LINNAILQTKIKTKNKKKNTHLRKQTVIPSK